MRLRRLCLCLVPAALACGGPQPARFAGSKEEPRVSADAIAEVGYHPRGYDLIGRVTSECEEVRHADAFEHALLSDVACSEELLTAALRLKAAAVGGELLVGRRCSADASSDGERIDRECLARVARARDEGRRLPPDAAGPAPGTHDDAPWLGVPADAWRVSAAFTPAPGNRRPAARALDEVHESPYLPASDVLLGDIVTRCCHGTCEPAVLREAVRATAARVGADSVSEVKCVEDGRGRFCTGRAGSFEVDPRTVAGAR